MEHARVLLDHRANGGDVVAPDRVDQLARLHQSRPARRLVAARQHELRIGQLYARGVRSLGMVLLELGERGGIAGAHGAEQILGLVLELRQVRPNGQMPGHDEPPWCCPGSARVGRRRFA